MLRFNELITEDRRRRYRYLIELPAFLLAATLFVSRVPYIWLMILVTLIILIDLYLMGSIEKESYTKSDFIKDGVILVALAILTGQFIAPLIHYQLMNTTEITNFNVYALINLMAYVLLNLLWYLTLMVENKVSNQPVYWKWKKAGPFSSRKSKFE